MTLLMETEPRYLRRLMDISTSLLRHSMALHRLFARNSVFALALSLAPWLVHGQGTARNAPTRATKQALKDTLQAILDNAIADSAFSGAVAVIGSHAGPLVTVTAGRQDWHSNY